MTSPTGDRVTILQRYETYQEGTVQVPFTPYTAKVFKITASRENGDGIVHLLELETLFE